MLAKIVGTSTIQASTKVSVAAVKAAGIFSGKGHWAPPDLVFSYKGCQGQEDSSWCWVELMGALAVVAVLVSDAFMPLEQPLSWSLEPWCSQSDSSSKLSGPGWPAVVVAPGLRVWVPVAQQWIGVWSMGICRATVALRSRTLASPQHDDLGA